MLKPGLNVVAELAGKKEYKNNIPALKQKLEEIKKKLPWVRILLSYYLPH